MLLLLVITVGASFVPQGLGNGIVSTAVAAAKIALIVLFFMKLRSSSPLLRLASLAGLFRLIFMFALTGSGYLSR